MRRGGSPLRYWPGLSIVERRAQDAWHRSPRVPNRRSISGGRCHTRRCRCCSTRRRRCGRRGWLPNPSLPLCRLLGRCLPRRRLHRRRLPGNGTFAGCGRPQRRRRVQGIRSGRPRVPNRRSISGGRCRTGRCLCCSTRRRRCGRRGGLPNPSLPLCRLLGRCLPRRRLHRRRLPGNGTFAGCGRPRR